MIYLEKSTRQENVKEAEIALEQIEQSMPAAMTYLKNLTI